MIIILLSHFLIKQGISFSLSLLCNLSFCIRLFHLQNDEIEEVELPGFDYQHQTLFSTNVISNQYLQVKNIRFHI
jgi:hypothetical protein